MKSLFQAIGVLKKDEEIITKEVKTSEQSAVAVEQPSKSSLISASLQNVVATTQAMDDIEANPTIVENYVAAFSQELQTDPELSGLFMTLEAANKLARVPDLKVRYQSALDVIGLAPETALQSANNYLPVLKKLAEKAIADITAEADPILAQHSEINQKLNEEKVSLAQRLNEVQVQLEQNFQEQQKVLIQRDSFQASIATAEEQMTKEFNNLHGILKSSIG